MIEMYDPHKRCIPPLTVWLSTFLVTTIIYVVLLYEDIIPVKQYDYIPVIVCMVFNGLFILYNVVYYCKVYKL